MRVAACSAGAEYRCGPNLCGPAGWPGPAAARRPVTRVRPSHTMGPCAPHAPYQWRAPRRPRPQLRPTSVTQQSGSTSPLPRHRAGQGQKPGLRGIREQQDTALSAPAIASAGAPEERASAAQVQLLGASGAACYCGRPEPGCLVLAAGATVRLRLSRCECVHRCRHNLAGGQVCPQRRSRVGFNHDRRRL